jgi:hypothetical protein
MFDSFDLGAGMGGDYSLSDGAGAGGYDTSGLGEWADYSAGLPASDWSAQADNPLSVGGEGILAQTEPGYSTRGLGAWAGGGGGGGEAAPEKSVLGAVGKALGFLDSKGNFDLTDPKTIDKMIKLGLGGMGIYGSIKGNRDTKQQQRDFLQQQLLQQQKQTWTPQQAQWANSFFQTAAPNVAPRRAGEGGIQSIIPSRGYAEGGPIEGEEMMMEEAPSGALGLIEGPGDGQSDSIDAKVTRGEYILDADLVSAIGNGSNEAGAEILDKWKEFIRDHKRSASKEDIPPPTKDLNEYFPKGALE